MGTLISTIVDWTIVPVTNVIVFAVDSGIAFVAFALVWLGFGIALVASQGSLDAAWQWIRALPIVVQALVWLLFLPVVGALWIWETTWPIVVRLPLVLGLAWWNLLIFLPSSGAAKP